MRDLFGVAAIAECRSASNWSCSSNDGIRIATTNGWASTRLRYDILGLKVPLIRMPVAPGRNLGVLVEVAARNQLLRTRGLNAARDLAARLEQTLREKDVNPDAESDDDVEHGGPV